MVKKIKNPNHNRAVGIFKPQTGKQKIAAELRGRQEREVLERPQDSKVLRFTPSSSSRKIRVNITVDENSLREAQKKLKLFGGKLSTLFNAYLDDFVKSMDKTPGKEHEELIEKVRELEERMKKLEGKN